MAILETNKEPLSAEEISGKLKDLEAMNFSTIYRNLNTLAQKGVLTKTGEPGGKVYFKLKLHQHAHELECTACHRHIPIDICPVESFSRQVNKETGFVVTEHQLKIKGLCADCANCEEDK